MRFEFLAATPHEFWGFHNIIRVITLVGQDSLGFQTIQKPQSLRALRRLAACQNESNGIAERITRPMDLGRKAATRPS